MNKPTALSMIAALLLGACAGDFESSNTEEVGAASQSVINGTEVTPNSVPYMAILSGLSPSTGGHRCGGSLIDPQYVLTAAHCVIERGYIAPPGVLKVVLGAHDLTTLNTDPKVQWIDSEYVTVHPGFDAATKSHDLAIIRLSRPATLNAWVKTVNLAHWGDGPGTVVEVAGWGKTSSTSDKSMVLRKGTFPLVANSVCDGVLQGSLDSSMLCAGYVPADPAQRVTACHGDSGGPLVVNRGGGYLEQVGVVSWGQADVCGTYSAYSRVTTQDAWIDWVLASGYRYLRCNNTGWNLRDGNRIRPVGVNSFQLDYDVTQLDDSCVMTHTNVLNDWGTRSGDYKLIWNNPPVTVPAGGNITWEGNYAEHFQIKYPSPGRYRISFPVPLTISQQTQFQITKLN